MHYRFARTGQGSTKAAPSGEDSDRVNREPRREVRIGEGRTGREKPRTLAIVGGRSVGRKRRGWRWRDGPARRRAPAEEEEEEGKPQPGSPPQRRGEEEEDDI